MKNVFVVAHRGFSARYPENTLLALEKAVECGCDFVEIDVRETADGALAVIHDATVDRTTNGSGAVAAMKRGEIRALEAGAWKGNFEGVGVPFLEEVLEAAAGRVRLIIEIKEARPDRVLALVRERRMAEEVVLASFHPGHLLEARRLSPATPTALISRAMPADARFLVENGIRLLNLDHRSWEAGRAGFFAARGISLGAWTVDLDEKMAYFAGSGVSFITTNRPDALERMLADRHPGASVAPGSGGGLV